MSRSPASPSFDASRPAALSPGNDNVREGNAAAPELDCLAGTIQHHTLRAAAKRARDLGVGADRVLIAWGAIGETDYLRRFAHHTGIAIETFTTVAPSDAILLDDDQIRYAARRGLLPMRRAGEMVFVVVLQRLVARELAQLAAQFPDAVIRIRIATADDFDAFLLHRTRDGLAREAAYGLRDRFPGLSAAPSSCHRLKRIAIGTTIGVALVLLAGLGMAAWSQMLAAWFIAAIGVRLAASAMSVNHPRTLPRLRDADLPVYTVIVALYREARCVPVLLHALDALDYPREKLDLIFAVEADDHETRTAIDRAGAPCPRVIVAPDLGPRTKPKALNAALSFARGSFVAVFDAEDRPDPGQLRAALAAFRDDPDIACVQAALCIDNAGDSLFTRMFAAEYAGQFDAVLPGLAAMRLPLPLGGTSNHVRTDVLRRVGGWDAWNVTEDADLGLRLARFGYRVETFASTTQEEAPITFPAWLKQRSRWMKGWMQTLGVHLRRPRQFRHEAGWRGVVTLAFVLAGPVVSALAYPALLVCLAVEAAHGGRWLLDGLLTPVHFTAIGAGLVATPVIGLIGLHRRGRLRDGWILLLTPLYWGCLSIATWRALYQLLRDPYRWEKTEHGLSKPDKPQKRGRWLAESLDRIFTQRLNTQPR